MGMKIERITEVGVAVPNLEQATQLLVDVLGAEAHPIQIVDRFQMRYRMCRLGKVDLELMEPIGDTAPFKLHLDGVDFAGRPFDADVKIAFAHPKSLLGVLFEFIEYPPGYDAR